MLTLEGVSRLIDAIGSPMLLSGIRSRRLFCMVLVCFFVTAPTDGQTHPNHSEELLYTPDTAREAFTSREYESNASMFPEHWLERVPQAEEVMATFGPSEEMEPEEYLVSVVPPTMMAVASAQDNLHALISASRPDTWTCRKRKTEFEEYEDLSVKQKRRVDWWWRGTPLVRQRFGHNIDHWRTMQTLYQKKDVCHLRDFVVHGITEITFLGVDISVNAAIAPKLKRVEYRLNAKGIKTAPFEIWGGFFPRTTRGPFGVGENLSRHALGIAVDFDWDKNPYFSRRELAFVEQLTDVRIKRKASFSPGDRWDSFKLANDRWNERIGPWLAETQRVIDAHKHRPKRGQARKIAKLRAQYRFVTTNRNLNRAIDNGFLSLPRDFVVEMEKEGLIWATDFGAGPDLMHFEFREYKGNPAYPWRKHRKKAAAKHKKTAPKSTHNKASP